MTTIKADELIDSVADALQFISYYYPLDFVDAVHNAWRREEYPAAKDALAQILVNRNRYSRSAGIYPREVVYNLEGVFRRLLAYQRFIC